MAKPLKFDPIEVPRNRPFNTLYVRADERRYIAMVNKTGSDRLHLTCASETAALIAALQVAHKAQVEAETLTFADLKPGEWFRLPDDAPPIVRRKMCHDKYGNDVMIHVTEDSWTTTCANASPVIRVRATFEDMKP